MAPYRALPRRAPAVVWLYLGFGLLAGSLYAAANSLFDALDRKAPLVATLAAVHGLVDRGIPLLAGALLGLVLHDRRQRGDVALLERARADELTRRLEHVARDQAVWVVATSTLHEIRNPLHTLGLLLEEAADAPLESASPADLLARARTQMGRIDQSMAALRRMASAVTPRIAPVSVQEVVFEVLERFRTRMGPREAHLEETIPSGLALAADPGFVKVILENMVQNACDARAPNEPAEVLVRAFETPKDVKIQVLDRGVGVRTEALAALFDPMTASAKEQGLGLGLPVSRALARSMQGDLVCVADAEWVTCFELRLPR